MSTTRKRRSDRNHVIYLLTNVVTGDTYVGLTVAIKRRYQYSAKRRFQKHVHRALTEMRDLPLCDSIREFGAEAFDVEALWVVRGKDAAHEVEREVVADLKPTLNVCLVQA